MKPETILNILWELKPTNKAAFIKYGLPLFSNEFEPEKDSSVRLRDFIIGYYGLKSYDFFNTKKGGSTEAKSVFYLLHSELISFDFKKMGMLTNRHRTSVYPAIKRIKNDIMNNKIVRERVDKIRELVILEKLAKS